MKAVRKKAWKRGAGLGLALWLCAEFGLVWIGAYLLSGAIGTLAALGVNRMLRLNS